MEMPEIELVNLAIDGSKPAIGNLYERYYDRLRNYLHARTGDIHIAEDLTQDVFVKVMEAIARFEQRGISFSAWVFKIARNKIVDGYRRQNTRSKHEENATTSASKIDSLPSINLADYVEKRDTLQRIFDAVEKFTPLQRDVFRLRFIGGLSLADTAQVLETTVKRVKTRQSRAIAKLRRMINPNSSNETS